MNYSRRDFLSAAAAAALLTEAGSVFAQGAAPAASESPLSGAGALPNNENRLRIINLPRPTADLPIA